MCVSTLQTWGGLQSAMPLGKGAPTPTLRGGTAAAAKWPRRSRRGLGDAMKHKSLRRQHGATIARGPMNFEINRLESRPQAQELGIWMRALTKIRSEEDQPSTRGRKGYPEAQGDGGVSRLDDNELRSAFLAAAELQAGATREAIAQSQASHADGPERLVREIAGKSGPRGKASVVEISASTIMPKLRGDDRDIVAFFKSFERWQGQANAGEGMLPNGKMKFLEKALADERRALNSLLVCSLLTVTAVMSVGKNGVRGRPTVEGARCIGWREYLGGEGGELAVKTASLCLRESVSFYPPLPSVSHRSAFHRYGRSVSG